MSRLKSWLTYGFASAALGLGLAMSPISARADDTRLTVVPAIKQSANASQGVSAQQVMWRQGWAGPGYYHGRAYYQPAPVYVPPRVYSAPYYGNGYYYGTPHRAYHRRYAPGAVYYGTPYGYYW